MKRNDDYKERRAHLADLTDEQLEQRFWELANKLVDPLLQMGRPGNQEEKTGSVGRTGGTNRQPELTSYYFFNRDFKKSRKTLLFFVTET